MSTEQCRTVMEVMNQLDGVNIHEKHGARFHFQLHLTQAMCDATLDVLDLGVRSYHCLKRAGYNTVGDLIDALSEGVDLKNIRNCGKTSVREIQEHLFLYQYYSLKPEKREKYLIETVEYNRRRIKDAEAV